MVYINLREMRELLPLIGLTSLAAHYKVDVFDLNNFIYSHKGRVGIYPVDGKRSRDPIKPSYTYPTKKALSFMLKKESAYKVSARLGVSYYGMLRYIKKVGLIIPK